MAVLILASTVAAGSVGLTDRLLNYVAGKYGQEAKLRLLEWQEIIKSHQKSDKQEKSYSTGEAGGLEKIVNRSKRFGNTPAN
ncbi:MAG: hypothetical protein HY889_05995 [Deltaproteobacteria bacterium]|nr:hypothetical protein [Deltaproteobacteria bacterium]